MEQPHILVEGDQWQYVPFGRARLKALRATGLSYASQTFVIDSTIIKVRIAGAQSYIQIDGGCRLLMDSGVIEANYRIIGDGIIDPISYLPGVLYKPSAALAYDAAFTEPEGNFLLNPGNTSAGQFSGRLTAGARHKGAVQVSGNPVSFTPGMILNGMPPPGFISNPEDGRLFQKKLAARLCPASMFTGKCRLYVQALYGAPLYGTDTDGNPTDKAKPQMIEASFTRVPSLILMPYRRLGDTTAYDSLGIGTSTGVYLHPATGKHFLVDPIIGAYGANVYIYPLIGSTCAEAQRKYLISGKLNAQDAEHLEAYILSTCLPDMANKVTLEAQTITLGGGMGYGWHWNWSGTTADIVISTPYVQRESLGIAYMGMESTHHRLSLNVTYSQEVGFTFSITQSVPEEKKQWAVKRAHWCMTQPDWGAGQLKVTSKRSDPISCDAPFYAFYIRDELKVCRVTVSLTTRTNLIESESRVWNRGYGYVGGTEGPDSGFFSSKVQSTDIEVGGFTCGGAGITGITRIEVHTDTRKDVSNKSWDGDFGDYYATAGGDIPTTTPITLQWFETGYALPAGGGYAVTWVYAYSKSGTSWNFNYSYSESIVNVVKQSFAEIVIPMFDAEAIFMRKEEQTTTTVESSTKWSRTSVGGYANNWFPRTTFTVPPPQTGYNRWNIGYDVGGAQYIGDTPDTSVPDPVTTTTSDGKLYCHAGTVDATFPGFDDFHDNDLESVAAKYNILTSAGTSTVVIGPGYIDPDIGISDAPAHPVIVGWI